MNRKLKLQLSLFSRLAEILDTETELFIQERPFLVDNSLSPTIIDLPTQRKAIHHDIGVVVREINKL